MTKREDSAGVSAPSEPSFRPATGFQEVAPSTYVADLLSSGLAAAVLAEFDDRDPWDQAQIAVARKARSGQTNIVGIVDPDRRNARRIRMRDIDLSPKPITAAVLAEVGAAVCHFVSGEFGLAFREIGGAEIIRYPQGGEFKPHTDTHRGNAERAFTAILYLNDDFAGGETAFPNLAYQCRPAAGRVLVFLPTELHAGLPVMLGEKVVLVFWVHFPNAPRRH